MNASIVTPPKRQFNVQLPPDLIAEIKHASIDEGLTLSEFVETVLRAGLRVHAEGQEPTAMAS